MLERRHHAPAVDLAALMKRPVLLTNVASLFAGFVMLENFVATIQYVQVPPESGYGLGFEPCWRGSAFSRQVWPWRSSHRFAGRLIGTRGPKWSMLLGLVVLFTGSLTRLVADTALWMIVASSLLIGVGTGLAFAAMPALVIAATPPQDVAAATGLNALSRSTGATIASAVSGVVLAMVTASGERFPAQSGFTILAAVAATAAAVAIGLIAFIPTAGAGTAVPSPRPLVG